MKRVIFFIVCFILWLLLTWAFKAPSILAGAAVALLATALFGEMFVENPKKCFQVQRYFWFLCYLPVFSWECLKANLDVAYRVLHPKMPIKPGIVKIKTNLTTDIAKTFLANSITMTPGTLTVDIKEGYLYIHWINVRSEKPEEATRIITGRFEPLLKRIFE